MRTEKEGPETIRSEQEERAYLRRKRIVSGISLAVFAGLIVFLTIVLWDPIVNLTRDPDYFRTWIQSCGVWGRFVLIGIMMLQVVVAIIPGELLEIAAGYAFGAIEGMLLCLAGAAIGSALIFLLTKRFGMKLVEAFISREKIESVRFLQNEKRLELITFIIFFIPGTPKDLLTYFAGMTPIRLRTFLLISTVARIPSVITSTVGGHALGMQDYTFAILVFVITGVVSAAGIVAYRLIIRRRQQKAGADGEPEAPASSAGSDGPDSPCPEEELPDQTTNPPLEPSTCPVMKEDSSEQRK